MDKLYQNLTSLNKWLKQESKKIEIHIIGGYALHLHDIGFARETEDIDNVKEILDKDIIDKIHEIGDSTGLDRWFDLGASSLSLPDDYLIRLVPVEHMSNIDIYLLSLKDIVILKVAAYFNRKDRGIVRDLEDLLTISPTMAEVDSGIEFIIDKYGSDLPVKFLQELKENLSELRSELEKFFG